MIPNRGLAHGRQSRNTNDRVKVKLSVRNLNFFYGSFHALKNINMDIPRRRSPPSSARPAAASRRCCAPSTACSSCTPSSAPKAEILLDGQNILDQQGGRRPDARAEVGMVFQKPTPFPMSIYDNIAFGVRAVREALAASRWTSASSGR